MNVSCISEPAFKVHRRQPELIRPANPTPYEFRPLSDIDDQDGVKLHIPIIQIYPHNPSMDGVDPVQSIREAISKTLVFYYPFAGRLREVAPTRKLVVECTSEGVSFIEADADITLHQSANSFLPPCPYFQDLLFDVPGSTDVLNSPLLFIQVTRLKCGGFVLALRFNHAMTDGLGIVKFMMDVGEISRGKQVPSILPVWERHLLTAMNSQNPTCFHPEYEFENKPTIPFPLDNLVQEAFFFGPEQLSIIRKSIPAHMHPCSTFEILTAFMWKCRTFSLALDPTRIMWMICLVNVCNRFNPPLVPKGYYGNGFMFSTVTSIAEDLIRNPLWYAMRLIRQAKENVSREYVQSAMNTLVSKGRPMFRIDGTYLMSDTSRLGFEEVDYGWGRAVYGGPARAVPTMASFLLSYRNNNGEDGILVPICLPIQAMERFKKEFKNMLQQKLIKPSL